MSVAFWSIKLSTGKEAVEVQPPENFVLILTLAALDLEGANKQSGNLSVKIETESIEGEPISSVLCTLNPDKFPQFSLNLAIGYDVATKFSVVGAKDAKGTVYLSGYYQPAPDDEGNFDGDMDDEDIDDDDDEEDDSEDDESEEEEEKERVFSKPISASKAPAPSKKAVPEPKVDKVAAKLSNLVKSAQAAREEYGSGSDDSEDEDEEEEEDSEEDSEDEEDDDESDDESEDLPPLKVQKTGQQSGVKSAPSSAQKAPQVSQPKTPQTDSKPKQAPQSGNQKAFGNGAKTPQGNGAKTPQGNGAKTPQTGGKPNQGPQSGQKNFNNQGPKSGDKRKR